MALERPGCVAILDDLKARKVAAGLDLTITGLLGVLLRAKKRNVLPQVAVPLRELRQAGFRFSAGLVEYVLRLAGEHPGFL